MIKLKKILMEDIREKAAENFIKNIIKGTEWENNVYIAGGAVRDELLGVSPKDLDLLIDAKDGGIKFAEWITKKIGNYVEGSNPVTFPRFGTAKFNLNGIKFNGQDLTGFEIEAVMPRSEKYTSGSRKPEVQQTDLKADAERRDLNINSLFKNISTGEILDLTGKGLEDLKNGIARTPIDPDKTFADDPLRMLRICRQSTKYKWKIPLEILRSIKKNAHLISTISAERVQDELNKILMTDSPQKGIKLLQILDLNKYILPEFEKVVGMKQNKFHQYDVSRHTYEVLKNSNPDLISRISALFHDLGKGEVRTEKDGKIQFLGHENESEKIVRKVLKRLKYETAFINTVALAVRNHMRTKSFGKDAELVTDKSLRELMNDLGDKLDNVLNLVHADNISHGDQEKNWPHNMPNQVTGMRNRIASLGNFGEPPINGTDIKELIAKEDPSFNPNGNPLIGKLKAILLDGFLSNPKMSKEEAEKMILTAYRLIKKDSTQFKKFDPKSKKK